MRKFTFCLFCFTCCVRIVFLSASVGPGNLLTAGTVCNRIVLPPVGAKFCVTCPPGCAGLIRRSWYDPLSCFSRIVLPCILCGRFWSVIWKSGKEWVRGGIFQVGTSKEVFGSSTKVSQKFCLKFSKIILRNCNWALLVTLTKHSVRNSHWWTREFASNDPSSFSHLNLIIFC